MSLRRPYRGSPAAGRPRKLEVVVLANPASPPTYQPTNQPTNTTPRNMMHRLAPLVRPLLLLLLPAVASSSGSSAPLPAVVPIVVHTWGGPFTVAADAAAAHLGRNHSHGHRSAEVVMDAVVAGASACERAQCDGTVGPFSSPDEACETSLDALLMDGNTLDVGAVGALPRIPHAVAVARHVLRYTRHSLLVGAAATRFAVENGFEEQDISRGGGDDDDDDAPCARWKRNRCQPNARVNVAPDPRAACGPYTPLPFPRHHHQQQQQPEDSSAGGNGHDTIALVALDARGNMAAGTSTNGRAHKIPGRVGDAPIPGSGAYVDSAVGGCGATGDGDVMMRFLPCYQAVESMRRGLSPREAADDAVRRMARRHPRLRAGLVVLSARGEHAAAATGWVFSYAFRTTHMDAAEVVVVQPISDGGGGGRGGDGGHDEDDARSEL